MIERLRLAIYGEHEALDHANEELDDLLWKVGEMRRGIESAHAKLDLMGAPKQTDAETLTLAGRLERIG